MWRSVASARARAPETRGARRTCLASPAYPPCMPAYLACPGFDIVIVDGLRSVSRVNEPRAYSPNNSCVRF